MSNPPSTERAETSMEVTERERFEAWLKLPENDWPADRERWAPEVYADPRTHAAWHAWKDRALLSSSGAGDAAVETGWIAATERLPQENQRVILTSESWPYPSIVRYTTDYMGAGPKFVETFRGEELAYWYPERMHWMPLPAAPGSEPIKQEKPEALSEEQIKSLWYETQWNLPMEQRVVALGRAIERAVIAQKGKGERE